MILFSKDKTGTYQVCESFMMIIQKKCEKIVYMKKDEHQLSAKIPSNVEIGNSIGFDLNDIFIFDENGKRLKS